MTTIEKSFQRGYKFQIYPDVEQKDLLDRTFGCCRFVYNQLLSRAIVDYETYKANPNLTKPSVSGYAFSSKLPCLKSEADNLWLNDVSSCALQQSALNLGKAFTRFFRIKKGYPKFKKRDQYQSFNLTANYFSLTNNQFIIARCKTPIRIGWHRQLPSLPSSCAISKSPTGKYYVSFTCTHIPNKTKGRGKIGIDLGLKDFLVTSDGIKIKNPKHLKRYERILKRRQQSLSRKKKGSKNRNKARLAVAKIHERIADTRNNFLHQLSRQLINENQVIGIEHLVVKNMVRNRKLAKHIADASWSRFVDMLKYKARESQHCTLVRMDTFYPSSHICSKDGYKLEYKLSLNVRSWICPHCGTTHDRDINAAINIKQEALKAIARIPTDASGMFVLAAN